MSTSKSLPVVAEIELIYKPNINFKTAPKVTSSRSAYLLVKEIWGEDTIQFVESFKVILLNRANLVLGVVEISKGGTAGTVVDPIWFLQPHSKLIPHR